MTDVYCSTKFRELEVHIQSRQLYNCCKAYPERIDLKWLEENPGQLFNTPTMVRDRKLMLSGQKCHSCDWGCYQQEDKGVISSRKDLFDRESANAISDLKTLSIVLSTDCNLTCAYCSAEWSTSWTNDIKKNGEYEIAGYSNQYSNWNQTWSKIKQKKRGFESKFFNLLKKEIELTPSIEKIYVLGGEPLLNNDLFDLLDLVPDKQIFITSGLGIATPRLEKVISKLKKFPDCTLDVSIEATNELFEFLRYGITWSDFQRNIDKLLDQDIKIRFGSVICNLSSFGLVDFYKQYHKVGEIMYNPVSDRPFLEINVLDDQSKIDFESNAIKNDFFDKTLQSINNPYTPKQKTDLKTFLLKFSARRDIDLRKVFPDHFLLWLKII